MQKRKKSKYKKKEVIQCYGMISLQLIGFFLITLYPMIWAIRLSFFYYNGVPSQTRFVGMDNYKVLFTRDIEYWRTWLTTFKFALLKLPIELPFAMLIALLLNRNIKCKGLLRAIYFLPSLIGVSIIGVIFFNLFDYFGIMNAWLTKTGILGKGVEWFSHSKTAMAVLVMGSVWSTFGVNVLYFLAALQGVPQELYEAVYVEGGGRIRAFFSVTLPMIAPVLQIILLLSINGTLHTNEYVLVMTGGGPAGTTHTVMSYVVGKFVPGFSGGNMDIGYGCSVSFITSILMAIIALLYMKGSRKLSDMY